MSFTFQKAKKMRRRKRRGLLTGIPESAILLVTKLRGSLSELRFGGLFLCATAPLGATHSPLRLKDAYNSGIAAKR